jgi:hypothetical protein
MYSLREQCDVLHFKNEITSGRENEYEQCCHDGTVELPTLLSYPDDIKSLLQEVNSEGRNFR